MKEFKGTKGKWYVPHMVDPNVKCNCNFILSDSIVGGVGGLFAIGYVDYAKNERDVYYETPTIEEATANAHLIAAAPELLEALIELVKINQQRLDGAGSWSCSKLWFRKTWNATERAVKAINKALEL